MLPLSVASVYVARGNAKETPVIFGQLTKRDGTFLIGRNAESDFKFENLKNKTVIGGRKGGMPFMTLQWVLEHNGLTIGNENETDKTYIKEADFGNMVAIFESGVGDYVTMFEPTASDYVNQGKGFRIANMGQLSIETPYTAFITKSNYLSKNEKRMEDFLKAVKKGYDFLMTASLDDAAAAIKDSFKMNSILDLKNSIASYKECDAWCATPAMQESAYNNLISVLTNAGELTETVPYSKVVNNSVANKVA